MAGSIPRWLKDYESAVDHGHDDPSGRILAAVLVPQQDYEWCWAAVSSMITTSLDPVGRIAQKRVVEGLLGPGKCVLKTPPKPSGLCCAMRARSVYATAQAKDLLPNMAARLGCGLTFVGREGKSCAGQVTLQEVKDAIDAGRPVGLHILSAGNGHFVVITGYDDDGWVRIFDPWPVAVCHCNCKGCPGAACPGGRPAASCPGENCRCPGPTNGGTIVWVPFVMLSGYGYYGGSLSGPWNFTYITAADPRQSEADPQH